MWAVQEIAYLKNEWGKSPTDSICAQLGRTYKAVRLKAKKIGLPLLGHSWTEQEITFLKENWPKSGARFVHEKFGRTNWAIRNKARKLGLPRLVSSVGKQGSLAVKLQQEHQELRAEYIKANYQFRTQHELACALGVSERTIYNDLHALNLRKQPNPPPLHIVSLRKHFCWKWQSWEIERVRELFPTKTAAEIATELGRTEKSVRHRIASLQIKKPKPNYVSLNETQTQIILGSLLGDAMIEHRWANGIFKETHSIQQLAYLEWKMNILRPALGGHMHYRKRRRGNGPLLDYAVYSSLARPQLNPFYEMFYGSTKKNLALQILDRLRALGLAVWFCDDGTNLHKCACDICTQGFSYEENELMANWFFTRMLIKVEVRSKKTPHGIRYLLHFPRKSAERFFQIINPFVHESMRYKITLTAHKARAKPKKRIRHHVVQAHVKKKTYYKHKLQTLEVYAKPELVQRASEKYRELSQSQILEPSTSPR
jgi:biotin operon repressor